LIPVPDEQCGLRRDGTWSASTLWRLNTQGIAMEECRKEHGYVSGNQRRGEKIERKKKKKGKKKGQDLKGEESFDTLSKTPKP